MDVEARLTIVFSRPCARPKAQLNFAPAELVSLSCDHTCVCMRDDRFCQSGHWSSRGRNFIARCSLSFRRRGQFLRRQVDCECPRPTDADRSRTSIKRRDNGQLLRWGVVPLDRTAVATLGFGTSALCGQSNNGSTHPFPWFRRCWRRLDGTARGERGKL